MIRFIRCLLSGVTLLVLGSVAVFAQVDTDADSLPQVALSSPLPPLTHWFQHVPEPLADFRGIVLAEAPTITLHPVLPYIFFDSASSEIPERYALFDAPVDSAQVLEPECTDDLACHYQVLNILGARLRRYPDLEIAIVGYNAERQGGEDSSHSVGRAESVRKYLHSIWGVQLERMRVIAAHGSPVGLRMSAPIPTWRVEARRVEIEPLFDPVDGMGWQERSSRHDSLNQLLFGPVADTAMEWITFPATIPVAVHDRDKTHAASSPRIDVELKGQVIDQINDMYIGMDSVSYFLMRIMPALIREGEGRLSFSLVIPDSSGRVRHSEVFWISFLVVPASDARSRFGTERRIIRRRVMSGLWREDPSPFGSVARGTIRLFRSEKVGKAYRVSLLSSVDSLGKSDRRHHVTYRTALSYDAALRPSVGERRLGVSAVGLGFNGLLGFSLPEERVLGESTYIILDFPRCTPSVPEQECRFNVVPDQRELHE